jgi:hypothetical protein
VYSRACFSGNRGIRRSVDAYKVLNECCGKRRPYLGVCKEPYCGSACQASHWPRHKETCQIKADGRNREGRRVGGSTQRKHKGNVEAVNDWFTSHPGPFMFTQCLAWEHRDKSPIILVYTTRTDLHGSSPGVTMIPRNIWEAGGGAISIPHPCVLRGKFRCGFVKYGQSVRGCVRTDATISVEGWKHRRGGVRREGLGSSLHKTSL